MLCIRGTCDEYYRAQNRIELDDRLLLQISSGGVRHSWDISRSYFCLVIVFASLVLTLCLPASSADNFGKQFGPRSGSKSLFRKKRRKE